MICAEAKTVQKSGHPMMYIFREEAELVHAGHIMLHGMANPEISSGAEQKAA